MCWDTAVRYDCQFKSMYESGVLPGNCKINNYNQENDFFCAGQGLVISSVQSLYRPAASPCVTN